MIAVNDVDFSNVDAVFCCLPHGTTQVFHWILLILSTLCIQYTFITLEENYLLFRSWLKIVEQNKKSIQNFCQHSLTNSFLLQEIIKALPKALKIVDLSAVSTGCLFFFSFTFYDDYPMSCL